MSNSHAPKTEGQVRQSSSQCDDCCFENIVSNRYFRIQPVDLRLSFHMTQRFLVVSN